MASISNSKTLFFTTSPRSPELISKYVKVLTEQFSGCIWNKETQSNFYDAICTIDEKKGKNLNKKNKDLAARDLITRAPKALGFVSLTPQIEITTAGINLLNSLNTEEVLLRQLLKFQLPSPYHTDSSKKFFIKPYLEIIRLVHYFGSLTFDEIMMFGMQMKDFRQFNYTVSKIESFRERKISAKSSGIKYKKFFQDEFTAEIRKIYVEELAEKETKTRESLDTSEKKFITTKKANLHDYTDALFRYLRDTGIVKISTYGKSLQIAKERLTEVNWILEKIDRTPCFVDDLPKYIEYLGNGKLPVLSTDNVKQLKEIIQTEFNYQSPLNDDVLDLQSMLFNMRLDRKNALIKQQIQQLKNQSLYDEIQDTFNNLESKEKCSDIYDPSLILEWNSWRALNIIDGGIISANLVFDDFGQPKSTAPGKQPDITCDYGDFAVAVELTMSTGDTQFKKESDSVPRHVGALKLQMNKETFGWFIAPKISEATIAFFYSLRAANLAIYGGRTIIVPLELCYFEKMLEDAHKAKYIPSPNNIKNFFMKAYKMADELYGQEEAHKIWYQKLKTLASNWLQE